MKRYAFRTAMFVAIAAFSLAGCDQAQEIGNALANAGASGPNPGVGGGGGGGGGSGGGGGGGSAGDCPVGTLQVTVGVEVHCRLSGTIITDVHLTADNVYQLDGGVFIGDDAGPDGSGGDPATLTIDAGTRIYGRASNSFLVISRGSRIEAIGTRFEPVIFTSAQDLGYDDELGLPDQRDTFAGVITDDPNTGEWGGLIINGRSHCNCTSALEGAGTGEGEVGSGQYGGGAAPALGDNSGTLRFVQVKYAGFLVNNEQELNGIAFQGVGSGTSVEHVHVHNGQDDGMEFFGGSVNVKFILISGASDDGFDWTEGWNGKAQFILIMQNPNTEASDDPRGIEADNLSSDHNALPRSSPYLSNFTIIGPAGDSAWPGNHGALFRRGTAGHIMNGVISDAELASLDVDDAATYGSGLVIESVLVGSNSQAGALATDTDDTDNDLPGFVDSGGATNNLITAPSLNGYVNGAAEKAMTPIDPSTVDPFFDSVDFVGAVNTLF